MTYTYTVTVTNAYYDWQNKDYTITARNSTDAVNQINKKYKIKSSQSGTEYSIIKL